MTIIDNCVTHINTSYINLLLLPYQQRYGQYYVLTKINMHFILLDVKKSKD